MNAVRVRALVDKEGELTLKGLPLKKNERVEVIILPEEEDETGLIMNLVSTSKSFSFLSEPEEDIYFLEDIKERA